MSKYTFRNATDEERKYGIPVSYGELVYNNPSDEQNALFFGRIIKLFGVNDSIGEEWEDMYNYPVVAEDGNGSKLYFLICGNIPEIATPYKKELPPDYRQAKTELLEFIENTPPADYEWEGFYSEVAELIENIGYIPEDVPLNVKYTVRDGKFYVKKYV